MACPRLYRDGDTLCWGHPCKVGDIPALASWASDDTIIRSIGILEKMAVGPKRRTFAAIKKAFINDHPSKQLLRRVMKQVYPNCKKHFIRTFFVKLVMSDAALKKEFSLKYGYSPPSSILISPTMRCNLRCTDCYAGNYQKNEDIDPLLLNRIINESKEIGVPIPTD